MVRTPLVPPASHAQWHGPRAALWLLGLLGAVKLVTGLIHFLLPDGGAGVIAGLDLGEQRDVIVGVFAWVGAIQIGSALVIALVLWRARPLVPALMLVFALEQGLLALSAFWLKPPALGHPPGHWGALVWVVLLAGGALLTVRRR